MYILAIETTGPVGSVAAAEVSAGADAPAAPMKVTTRAMSHLKNLMPMAAELIAGQHIEMSDICAVAASVGPGSFTGIRIGVSTARALAQAWDIPCISVPTLELFRPLAPSCAVFNARRGQVYAACYGEGGEVLIEPGPYMLDEVLGKIEESGSKPVFYGDGIDAYFDKDEYRERVSAYEVAPAERRYQTADMTAGYALSVWNGTGSCEPGGRVVTYDELLPDYMRESEAEQRLKDGSLERMRREKLERFMKMAGKQA